MANQKPRSTTQKKKTGPSSRGTSKSGGGSSKRSTKGKSTIKSKLIYELEIILLVVFTVISVFSIHTGAVGYFGTLLKGLYFGLFSKVAVIVPYFVMFIVFVNINPNLEKVRTKYNIALGSTLLAIILFYSTVVYEISIEALSISKANIFSIAGIKEIYFSAIRGNGAGVFGMYISHLFISLFGTIGSYVIAVGLILAGIILGTKVSLSDIWRIQKNMATATTNKAIQIAKNTGEAIADSMQPSEEQETGEVVESAKPQKKSFKIFDSDSYLPTKEASSSKTESNDQSTNSTKEPSVSFSEDSNKQIKISTFDGDSKIEEVDAKQADITVEKINTNANPTTGKETSANDGKGTKEKKENQKLDPNEVKEVSDALDKATHETYENYVIPSVSLLKKNTSQVSTNKQEILAKAKLLEETLGNFGVEAKVVEISKGPAITMFELQPSPGVKVSKIVNLSDDIALSLAASQVRIIAPIPGKSAVGIEIPNKDTSLVTLRDVLDTKEFKDNKSKLTFALGKDISGNPILSDLSKMPHLLIAGATGSGKSVCVNTLITSILFNATPDEVKFLMIDPKVVELNNYNGIPHLILPVVTDPKKASIALNWAVQEMTRRYQMFAETGVRDVNSYNVKAIKESLEKLPKIVVIIDELADLMMVAPNQVEDAICRLAQMARAAGIHLIVATQRPSVDVITGLIKANIPSRIAFSVSSMTDSRTILDMGGAEKLLGKGDMLFYPVGSSKPQRVQGAFVSDEEVENLVSFVKGQSQEVVYNDSILEEATFETSNNNNCDEYLEDAIEFVVRSQQASISMLQRKFRVGYNRAARLVDEMEERGIIGPSLGSKPREVLLDSSELENLN